MSLAALVDEDPRNPAIVERTLCDRLESEIDANFAVARRLGREVLRARRKITKRDGETVQPLDDFRQLSSMQCRLAQRLDAIRSRIAALYKLYASHNALFSDIRHVDEVIELDHVRRIERALRRWDLIQKRLAVL